MQICWKHKKRNNKSTHRLWKQTSCGSNKTRWRMI